MEQRAVKSEQSAGDGKVRRSGQKRMIKLMIARCEGNPAHRPDMPAGVVPLLHTNQGERTKFRVFFFVWARMHLSLCLMMFDCSELTFFSPFDGLSKKRY